MPEELRDSLESVAADRVVKASDWPKSPMDILRLADGDTGRATDFSMIEEAILDCCARFDVRSVTYDPWSATQLAQRMMEKNVPMIEYPMTLAA